MLTIEHLSKTYKGGKKAVDDLSLTVTAGDIYGFIGHNGAGKTTTIKAITGVLEFEEGAVTIDGHDCRDEPLACKQVTAYIPDNPDLYDYLTGIQFLNFIADVFQISAEERGAAIEQYGNLFELTPHLGDLISSYSRGMKQKLAVISGLIHRPRLLVLDEPFVGLDPKASLALKNTMRRLCAEGCAIFFSTHVLEVAEKLCNKIAIIKNGRLVAAGPTTEILGDSSLEHVFMEILNDEE